MPVEIRSVGAEDVAAAIDVMSTAFMERPDIPRIAASVGEDFEPGRTWLAWDGGRPCGTFRSWGTEITLPGLGRLPAAAVAAVTVLPTHRRRGILRRLADTEHRALRERGEAMALLYASEFGIYGRFGYGPATRITSWTVNLVRTGFVTPTDGRVELVTPDTGARDAVREVFEARRTTSAGEIRRRDFTWDVRLGIRDESWGRTWRGFLALHRGDDGRVDGYARYTAEEKELDRLPDGLVEVQELAAANEAAEAGLWSYLGSVDLVSTIRAYGRSPSDRLPWRVVNPRAVAMTGLGDGMWVRLFDVPRSLAARGYEREGRLVLEVIDDQASGGRWRLALDATPDGATCTATDESPDLTLPVAALGSVYLGAHHLGDVALRLGVDEHRAGALAAADALFTTVGEPWCSTFF